MKRMLDAGLTVTLNTDDPSVSETTLSSELQHCESAGVGVGDIKKAMIAAVEGLFAPREARERLKRAMEDSW